MASYKGGISFISILIHCLLVQCQADIPPQDEKPLTENQENPSELTPPFHSLFKFGDFSNIEKTIQDDLKRMSDIMDGKFTDEFPFKKFASDFEEKPSIQSSTEEELGVELSKENRTDSDMNSHKNMFFIQEPLITFEKLFKTLEELTKPAEMSSAGDFDDVPIIMVTNLDIEPEKVGKLGEENDPFNGIFPTKVELLPDDEENIERPDETFKILGYFDDLFQRIFSKPYDSNANMTKHTEDLPELLIKIEDHGFVYNIPPHPYIDSTIPGIVTIIWESDEQKNFNNSLCLKVSRDDRGHIIFQHVHLKIRRNNQTHEYHLDNPVHLNVNEPNTRITVSEGVQVNFPNFDSLDVIMQHTKEKYSTHWVLFMVAVLGLIIAMFVMLLSYVIHSKNRQYFAEKDDISKQPIA